MRRQRSASANKISRKRRKWVSLSQSTSHHSQSRNKLEALCRCSLTSSQVVLHFPPLKKMKTQKIKAPRIRWVLTSLKKGQCQWASVKRVKACRCQMQFKDYNPWLPSVFNWVNWQKSNHLTVLHVFYQTYHRCSRRYKRKLCRSMWKPMPSHELSINWR